MASCALAGLLPEGRFGIACAQAREDRYPFDIPAGPLAASLTRFSAIAGLSLGYPGDLPSTPAPAVRGMMSADAALRRLLEGSGLKAVRIGPRLYRLEPRSAHAARTRRPAARTVPAIARAELVVTAQKRPQSLGDVAMAVAVVPLGEGESGARPLSSRDVGLDVEGLAMTNLGPGRNRQFIRGVADSPFVGPSQSSVSVQVDEARATFNAPDPDLRLVDIDRVELLKGPQGPLYGSGALGGIYHIVTRRPDLGGASAWARLSAVAVDHGGTGTGEEAVVNVPLIRDRLAVRAVGYRSLDPGWIDDQTRGRDSNAAETRGMRLSVRWLPSGDWSVDAGYMFQSINLRDSQYVLASDKSLRRQERIAEPTDNDFGLAHATLSGPLGGLRLLSATSYVDQDFKNVQDATAAASLFGLSGPVTFNEHRHYTLFNQELRLSSGTDSRWVAGLSFLRAALGGNATMTAEGNGPLTVEQTHRQVTEYALFGEITRPVLSQWDATLGLRLYRSISQDETRERERGTGQKLDKIILSPSFALSHPLAGGGLVYLRYARAMRPGGLAPAGMTASGHFDADELGTLDLGFRRGFWGDRLNLAAGGFFTEWMEIQSDYLLPNGLVSTRNAGRARILGIEATVDWQIGAGFSLSLGGLAQNGRLTRSEDGTRIDDRRLPITPDVTARAALSKRWTAGSWSGQSTIQLNHVGSARLSFDDDLDRDMEPYTVVAMDMGAVRGAWTLGLRIDNLFDIRGDSFAFGNPFSIRAGPQYTPLRPRAATVSLSRRW